MEVVRLSASAFLSIPNHGYASVISDPKQFGFCHQHDYYEIFIVSQGLGLHIVNGEQQKLEPGMLYFMRPNDVHYYDKFTSSFQLINIIIPFNIMDKFIDFVGDSFYVDRLLSPKMPPHVTLPLKELSSLKETLKQLIISARIMKAESNTLFHIAMFQILTTYFPVLPKKNRADIPEWLQLVNIEMTKKQNFTEGLPALYRISGKSAEHVSRTCKKLLNKTPSQLVNDMRLEYAASQLIQTNDKIINICTDSGFESLSHFYHLFQNYFGSTPKLFRLYTRELSLQDQTSENAEHSIELANAIPLNAVIEID